MNLDDLSTEQKRKLLLTPAQSKAALQNWIRQFLDLDLPDCTIDPTSNSSPLECLWEIYSKALRNDDPDFSSILVYAAREGVKTLLASIIEVLAVLHLDRSVVHLAARLEQSNKAQGYVTAFFQRPVLRDFITGNAVRQKEFAWWEHPITGEVLTEKEFKAAKQPDGYLYRRNEIVIIVATLQSVNGQHSSLVVEDELDVMQNPLVYEEAKMIPTPYKGKNPITLMVSSRKFAHGLVQKEIDQAEQTGLRIRHWNIYDVTQNCPSSRHRPDLPKVDIAYSEQTLVAITRREYDALPSDRKETFKIDQGYAGCIQNCKMFATCRGRLADRPVVILPRVGQNLLKPISHIQNQFRRNTLDMVKAQMMCWRPSTVGMVYPNLDREVHMLTAAEIAFMLDGEEHPPEMTKSELIALFQERGARCHAAQDYGFTHNFVNTTGFRDGNRLFVVDCLAQAELEVEQQIALCDTRIRAWDPTVVGDAENPEAIRKFRKAGYRISAIKKGAGSVVSGIERVRGMIRPAIGLPTVYFLAGDPGVDFLVKSLELYHWKLDAAGNPTGEPDDADDDAPDSFRYLVMSLGMGGVVAPKETPPQPTQAPTAQNWMRQQITQAIGQSIGVDIAPKEGPAVVDFSGGASDGRRGRRGRLFWST